MKECEICGEQDLFSEMFAKYGGGRACAKCTIRYSFPTNERASALRKKLIAELIRARELEGEQLAGIEEEEL